MKELETHLKLQEQNKIELNIKNKQEVEYVLQGTLKPQTGHFIWEVNEVTGEIKKAEFKKTIATFGASMKAEELVINPDCIYIPSLNGKNAFKKYNQDKRQATYYSKVAPMNLSDSF